MNRDLIIQYANEQLIIQANEQRLNYTINVLMNRDLIIQ